ncbi:MAG TPA: hypothetical protein VN894_08755, partial [Polyangiaceae bacterium]|nr:hypothetical protein [Polyangiaceae bacterium]
VTTCTSTDAGTTLTNCNGACVDLSSDNLNCSGCNKQCAIGGSCVSGACTCGPGDIQCGVTCTNTNADDANCGKCGTRCAMGTTCQSGVCTAGCGSQGLTMCTGVGRGMMMVTTCVDTSISAANCGACGVACDVGSACVDGTCTCAAGDTQCMRGAFMGRGLCVDLQQSNANCGACGTRCPGTAPLCSDGTCVIQCLSNQSQCPGAGRGGGNTCVDLSSSKGNCGFCGATCGGNLNCVNSQCTCGAPFTDCAGTCTDTTSSNTDCGTCGTVCVAPSTCQNGACR